MLDQVAAETDRVDVLVHCAVKTVSGPILEADPDAFGSAVQVSAVSLPYVIQSALPLLGSGSSIIFRGSRMALKNYASVGAPKAFAEAMIRYLAVELAPREPASMRCLRPRRTPKPSSDFPQDYEERLAAAARNSPSGHAVGLGDIVDSARFLGLTRGCDDARASSHPRRSRGVGGFGVTPAPHVFPAPPILAARAYRCVGSTTRVGLSGTRDHEAVRETLSCRSASPVSRTIRALTHGAFGHPGHYRAVPSDIGEPHPAPASVPDALAWWMPNLH